MAEGTSAVGSAAGSTDSRPIAEMMGAVVRHDWVNDAYKHLVLDVPDTALTVVPGQFFHLLCPTVGDDAPYLRRPMSVYRIDRGGKRIEFLYKVIGAGTRTLASLEPGGRLDIFGPLGHGFTLAPAQRHVVMVVRGVGLATCAPLAEAAVGGGARVTAILSARSPDYLMSEDYLRAAGATVMTVTDAENTSGVEAVEAIVGRLIDDEGGDLLVTCGSNRLLQLLQRMGRERGVRGEVALEQTMGCGVGMCYACVRPFRTAEGVAHLRVCWDGPVFDIQEAPTW